MEQAEKNDLQVLGHKPYLDWVEDYWTSRGNPLDFKKHTYLLQVYEDQHPFIVFMKPAQTGLTERMITEAIWLPDQFKENSIYFMPTAGLMGDLVQERVDEPFNNNPYLQKVLGRSKRLLKQPDKTSLKRMSKGFAYFRGSNKPNQISTIAGDAIFVDELDRMMMESVPYFDKRLEHSNRKWQRWASTPTIADFGIHKLYKESDQHEWWLTCRNCGLSQVLDFFVNVNTERAMIVCANQGCKFQMIPWECKGVWKPANPTSKIRGYKIPQLCSPFLDLSKAIRQSRSAAESEVQQFYNQVLGVPYEPKGAKLTEEDLNGCIQKYRSPFKKPEFTFMGVDVGRDLHYIVRTEKRVCAIGKVPNFTGNNSIEQVMKEFRVKGCVIDALPETRKAQELAMLFPRRVKLSYYTGVAEMSEATTYYKVNEDKVNSDRTIGLDHVFAEVRMKELELPENLDDFQEFKDHMKSTTRVKREDRKGVEKAVYVETSADHYLHALNYSKMAVNIYNLPVPEVFVI